MPRNVALAYFAAWSIAILGALVILIRTPRAFGILSRAYFKNLFTPWKVVTFLIAASFFVVAAPYTGDPTWDHVDGALMSGLTFLTAPWAIGTIARARKPRAPRKTRATPRQVYVAAVLWLLSASWCYDGYLFARDGAYPRTWWTNLFASSTMYACAGMMWSLTYVKGGLSKESAAAAQAGGVRGALAEVAFDFMTEDWYAAPRARFGKIAIFAGLLMLTIAGALLPFAIEVAKSLRH